MVKNKTLDKTPGNEMILGDVEPTKVSLWTYVTNFFFFKTNI